MKKIIEHQFWHFLLLWVLLIGMYFLVSYDSSFLNGQLMGIDTTCWLILATLSPIVHQVYVLISWRLELYYKSITAYFGERGFTLYKIGFSLLIFSRFLTIVLLALSNRYTFRINVWLTSLLFALLFFPSAYLFYSVKKYFGMDRAFGIDHFNPEKLKNKPFVKKGVFKYTSNGMYIYGFLILWIPGLLFYSKAALMAAAFNHLYIWVHYYFTELPDIKKIYND